MTWAHRIGLALLALASFLAAPAAAQASLPPRPAGPVYDGAEIIPDADERLMDARLREYSARTGRTIVVATVPSLGGETIEAYAGTLFNTWGISDAATDRGLLVLVAPDDRKMRIEVGYGLVERVTDDFAGQVIRDEITPRFRDGDFAGGISDGLDALVAQLDREPAAAKAAADAAAHQDTIFKPLSERTSRDWWALFGVFFWVVIITFFWWKVYPRLWGRH